MRKDKAKATALARYACALGPDASTYRFHQLLTDVQSQARSSDRTGKISRAAGGSAFSAPVRVSTASSNPDGSGYNSLQEQFIGDSIGIVAGPTSAYVLWTDARNATPCQAVDDFRNAVYAGSKTAVAPNPDNACATSFGNTDTEAAIINY